MKKSRYREEQIIGILKQHEAGIKTADLCREHGIGTATFYGWKTPGSVSVCRDTYGCLTGVSMVRHHAMKIRSKLVNRLDRAIAPHPTTALICTSALQQMISSP